MQEKVSHPGKRKGIDPMKNKARILIVDDDPNILSSLSDVVRDMGYTVIPADTGAKAIEKAGKHRFSVAMIDIRLPDMDGIKVLRSIKKINPDVSVIVITAHAGLDTSIKALEEGAYDYIIKPFKVEHIKKVINRAAEKQKLLEKNRTLVHKLTDSNKKLQVYLKELKKAQKECLQAEKVSTISQMLVTLHHEINNPLMIIMGAAQSMRSEVKDKEVKHNVRLITKNTRRISGLIEKGRKISRPVVVDYMGTAKMIDLKKGVRRK